MGENSHKKELKLYVLRKCNYNLIK